MAHGPGGVLLARASIGGAREAMRRAGYEEREEERANRGDRADRAQLDALSPRV